MQTATLNKKDIEDFQNAPFIFGVVDRARNTFVHLNEAFEEITGFKIVDVLDKSNSVSRVIPGEEDHKELFAQTGIVFDQTWVNKRGKQLDIHCLVIRKGRYIYLEAFKKP